MGAWYLSLSLSLFLILIGMTTHWSVMLAGMLLLFVPTISMLLARRRKRADANRSESDANFSTTSPDPGEKRGTDK